MIGRTLGQYRILQSLGAGGMGEVFLAEDPVRGHQVALKVLHTSHPRELRRLHEEARAASAIDHPNVAHIYELSKDDGVSFLAMEYVSGWSLDTLIATRPPDIERAIDIAMQIADALVDAEAKGITHRDLKPANIMVTDDGTAKILDFGLARVQTAGDTGPRLTAPGVMVGTLDYMSPEQALACEVDTRSDIFSLGVIVYECITGTRPFSGLNAAETMNRLLHFDPEPPAALNPAVPLELSRIISKCTAKLPSERYQRAQDLLADLRILRSRRWQPTGEPPPAPATRPWGLYALAGLVLLVAAIGLYAVLGH
ncbi:MAG: serine/threonine-protein kinase [Thermoanaerobaculia bacterium]